MKGSACGAQCFKASLASCSSLYIVDCHAQFLGWEHHRLLASTMFCFSSFTNARLDQRGQFLLCGSSPGDKRAHLQCKWSPRNPGSRDQPLNLCCVSSGLCLLTPMPSAVITVSQSTPPSPHSFQGPVVFCLLCCTCSHHPTFPKISAIALSFLWPPSAMVSPQLHGLLQRRRKAQQTNPVFL